MPSQRYNLVKRLRPDSCARLTRIFAQITAENLADSREQRTVHATKPHSA
jgi:hypothetical protein